MFRFLRLLLICCAFVGTVMIAFSRPELMADGIGDCVRYVCQGCDESSSCDPDGCPQDVCENCHDSSLHFLTDLRHGAAGGLEDISEFHLWSGERVLVPDGPYLDTAEPPLI